jgi:type I restriction enzyme S subunit
MKQARRTAVQYNINARQISAIEIPLPPLPLQQQFAQIVTKYRRVGAQHREAERQAKHLFQALLQRAFRGEV